MTDTGPAGTKTSGAYRVLARKYRPRDFSGLIGQEPMVRTLTNAFAAGRIAQAWMLTGVRGVGKTTTARILARALNYKTSEIDRPSVDLSVMGEHCEAILEGRHVDVIEMDAASHTGIDDIREIIEQVRYAPIAARYKVYIIDEVHMLSTQAFNGLLKTLEEPPEHVKFIFATTEIRKVPITILSRCQRFDLRRISAGDIKGHLARIGTQEGVEAEETALAMIARAADGSMRDAQSIFDQAIAHSSGNVTSDTVRDMLGLADRSRILDLFEHLLSGNVADALSELRSLYDVGADPATVLTDLAEFNHLVTRLKYVPDAAQDGTLTEDERVKGGAFAEKLSVRVLSRTWQMLLKGVQEVQGASRPIAAAEMVLIRIAHAANLPTLDEALRMLSEGEGLGPTSGGRSGGGGGANGGGAMAVGQSGGQPGGGSGGGPRMTLVQSGSAALASRPAFQKAQAPQEQEVAVPITSLADIADLADHYRDMAFKVTFKQFVRLVSIEPGKLAINVADGAPATLVGDIIARLQTWTGIRWIVSISNEKGSQTLREEDDERREIAFEDARADPTVIAILQGFPGAKIVDVRIANADMQTDEHGDYMESDPFAEDDDFD